MTALRFPKAEGAFVVLDQHAQHAQDPTREIRVSVRHVVCYWPTTMGESLVVIEGRPGTLRVAQSCDELDDLMAGHRVTPLDSVIR